MHDFRKLEVWNLAIELVVKVYEVSNKFPPKEQYSLTSQVTRSAVSIASNIAEGAGRNTKGEFANFLGIANGSTYELLTQLIIANKLSYIAEEKFNELQDITLSIQKMLYRLLQTLK